MPQRNQGYWIELSGIQFNEGEQITHMQALPLGSYHHPVYGRINVTPEKVARMVQNFNDGVRGTDIDIDYDHKVNTGKAAGWVRAMHAKPDGLWFDVEWTQAAKDSIKAGEYKYFSPEFADAWKHPKTGKVHKDVVFGGGITNRPFLKDILPINLSEIFGSEPYEGGNAVEELLKQLAEMLGLSNDSTQEQILASLTTKLSEGGDDADGDDDTDEGEGEEENGESGESETELAQLAEKNPLVKKLMEEQAAASRRLIALEATNTLHEVSSAVTKLTEGKGFAIAPKVQDKLVKVLCLTESKVRADLLSVLGELTSNIIELGERGGRKSPFVGDPSKQFNEKIKAKQAEGMSYADAAVALSAEEPELFEAYMAQEGVTL